ncbi:MAG: LysR family transcriptional regulator, partial [Lachnospiraceae bacterium]|nr:LysR family transcriptional regulator [Lachnospiraceae bacterium]
MDLRILEYVVSIEEYGSMTEAAEKLYITPSALNQQLLKLEKELGTPLFTRSKRRMIPTAAGRAYLEGARRMLSIRQETYA